MTPIPTIEATVPLVAPPSWAVWERALFTAMDTAVQPFLDKYTDADGTLIFRDHWTNGRDGADDLYESSYNWSLLYLLGGGNHLLPLAHRQWEAITRQLTALGPVEREYERGYDQFHQGESDIAFYFLCLADPTNPTLIARARRFADMYTGDDPNAPNYDPEHNLIRAPHNGSGGPRWGTGNGEARYGWAAGMATYGLPFTDLPGIATYDDLKDPANARRMGAAMHERMGRGDAVSNLIVTSLVTNAYLLTGDARYQEWVLRYTEGWITRAAENGGLLPDTVGLSGQIGEYLGGKWYGGLYGWTWPHGFYNIGMAALIAAGNATLLARDPRYLDLPRTQIDAIWAKGEERDLRDLPMSLAHHWAHLLEGRDRAYVVPYRHGDDGWFDYQPMSPVFPVALWNLSMESDDWGCVTRLNAEDDPVWVRVQSFRTKEESGHEQPWFRFLAGGNPHYPEAILQAAYAQVCRRLALIRADHADLTQVNVHHWQELNPVLTEALVQLTLGAPQHIYNGGLLHARVRYWDAEHRRPGLPPDVAALVETITADRTVLRLVNLSPTDRRTVIVQAGVFGEHRFGMARYATRTSDYPGVQGAYTAPPLVTEAREIAVNGPHLRVLLPPATEITLDLVTERYVNVPSYQEPPMV